ncbi:PREDICTED: F-box protein At5g62510-like [Brassica oleracea var. oleracea]|uniref:F-box protein At5g62510-like n=1 Tax=Brassica oleracea var. oleracea TaxID=109376 RepID=UPI0006A71E04|nr:PREDICTED: F-box protein At5g62510-like [Brassica oleracea var. oleracea]
MEKADTGGGPSTKTPEEMMSSMALQKGQRMFMDVTIPILQQLPAARLARFMVVDTEWRKTILSQTFEKEYLSLAEKKPKILFVATSKSKTDGETYHMFRSLLKKADESSTLPLTLPQSVGATLRSDITYQISQSVRDMVCLYHKRTCLICNPSVGRYVALPHVDNDSVFFLGFNPVATTFKVLSLDNDGGSARVRVLTVSPEGNNNWRTLYSGIAHTAYGPGLCLAGTIYYTAHVRMFEQVLMCCDLQTEEFRCIHLPGQLDDGLILSQGQSVRLVNFHNKPGLVEGDGMAADLLTLWQLEDSNWCKRQFNIPTTPLGLFEGDEHKFIGTGDVGELIYAPCYKNVPGYRFHEQYVIYYDYVRATVTKVRIQGDFNGFEGDVEPFGDYIESTALISTGTPM